jgi:tRNA threonylcarbamoyladenosine biosynthesis protein TsaB
VNLLVVDTSTEACSLALSVGAQRYSRHVVAGRDHTALLLPLLHELLTDAGLHAAEVDGLVCGVGPGSFAGVRVGVGFVKGFALARELPVVPVSSLATLAQGAMRRTGMARVLACIDARMGEVYCASFERDAGSGLARLASAARVCPPDAVDLQLPFPWAVTGTGWGTYGAALRTRCAVAAEAEEPQALPEALDALALAQPSFARGEAISADQLEPMYLRDSVALKLEQQAAARAQRLQSSSKPREKS